MVVIMRHISFSFFMFSTFSIRLLYISLRFILLSRLGVLDFSVVSATLHVLTLAWSSAQLYDSSHVRKIRMIP